MAKFEQEVDYRESPVPCSACGNDTHKKNFPEKAMPLLPRNAELVTRYTGLAMCRNAECSEGSNHNPIFWWYRRND